MNEVSIQARLGNQFLMSAPLDNVPAIEDQDLVGIAHRFQPVGDQDQGFPLCQRGDRGLEFRFRSPGLRWPWPRPELRWARP